MAIGQCEAFNFQGQLLKIIDKKDHMLLISKIISS